MTIWISLVVCVSFCSIAVQGQLISCSPNTCRNGGTCSPNVDGASFSCLCPPGFSGRICEVPREHPCFTQPCQNGGKCLSKKPGYYYCICPNLFEGGNCERRRVNNRPCPFRTCIYGRCIRNIFGLRRCKCDPGYDGYRCERRFYPFQYPAYPCFGKFCFLRG